jgi:Sperm-tail PG-rich repeat
MNDKPNMYKYDPSPVFKESAETLRKKRPSSFGFSRAERFSFRYKKEDVGFIAFPSTLDRRGTSIGYGKRWEPDTTTHYTPSPCSYDVSVNILNTRKKKIKNFYSKNLNLTQAIPGPGSYELEKPIGKDSPKISFRTKHYDLKYSTSPSPNTYSPVVLSTAAYTNISFGLGQRYFMKNTTNDTPGPGTYETPTDFNKKRPKRTNKL